MLQPIDSASSTTTLRLPDYPDIRIIFYLSHRYINLCAPPGGLVMILPAR